jgi:hypothetical protein
VVFHSKSDRAEWRIIYDEVRKMSSGDVLTYDRLTELLGRDFHTNRTPLTRAMQELEDADQRTLACERGVGYRIAAATEHETLARKHSTRSRRQLTKAAAKARSADRSALSPEQARRLDDLELQFSQHAELLDRLDERDRKRAAEIRQLRRDTTGDIADLSDQITKLAQTLRRHGIDPEADGRAEAPTDDAAAADAQVETVTTHSTGRLPSHQRAT